MDPLTLTGLILALVTIMGGQYLEGGEVAALLNGPAFMIVVGGTIGAVLLQTPFSTFKRALRMMGRVVTPPVYPVQRTVNRLVTLSRQARKEGIVSLENHLNQERNPFTRKGLTALVQGSELSVIRRTLEVDLETEELYDLQAIRVFESMGGYSPTIGIIGAVIGLISVMQDLSDPSVIGAGIAVAFVATIYGIGLANIVFIPVAHKLKSQLYQKVRYREMIIEGILSIADAENPRVMELKLRGFIETPLSGAI